MAVGEFGRLRKETPRAWPLAMSFPLCLPELPSAQEGPNEGPLRNTGPSRLDLDLPEGPVLKSHGRMPDPTRPQQGEDTTKPVTDGTPAPELPLLSAYPEPVSLHRLLRWPLPGCCDTHNPTPSTCPTHRAHTPTHSGHSFCAYRRSLGHRARRAPGLKTT